ncbi:MAG TPA: acylphosphatase [Tenuifilaceae bacterium]|nr:acylphosphatase [Tenuifilaceae bacterium]HOZ15849.1 acylphosphatase [Tenuifilaceae bacterium]HPN21069.1 acylphosphatase [Tenuifilaceae bacterium]HPV55641.1 acylphosphatase [Tenuifilaceae bacterium]
MKTVSLTIKGRVQGVGFRYFVMRTAMQLGVNGYVMNCADGNVYVEAEADDSVLVQFVDLCSIGPSRSNVEDVVVRELEPKKFTDFNIRGF